MRILIATFTLLLLFSQLLYPQTNNHDKSFKNLIHKHKIDLEDKSSLDSIVSMASGRKVTLLGEASHGTSEFYSWRDSISRRLIAEQGYRFILVEGDWASLFLLNRYVKGFSDYSTATEVVQQFDRWPAWMWRNLEIVELAEWLKSYNDKLDPHQKVGLYGMDVYDEWNSYDEVMSFLAEYDAELYNAINTYYDCVSRFGRDSWQYAGAIARGYETCAPILKQAFDQLDSQLSADEEIHPYDLLYILQNARVFKNAEKFFRKAVSDRSASWNSRVEHMFNTLLTLIDFHGEDAKAIVWAHNTHIGDARYTDMHQQNQVNIGRLTREHFGEDKTLLVGFGTYKGKVTAGRQWGADMLELNLPAAMPGSIEEKLHSAHHGNYLLVMNPELNANPYFSELIGNRAVGVVYNPQQERPGNYVPTVFGKRYDCFIFIEKTKPLRYVD